MAPTKLYAIPASHPSAVVERAFQLKGVDYKRVDLIPMTHVPLQKLRFGRRIVPGVVFDDGTKVQGSRAIVRELERRAPEPSLLTDQPPVAEAETWGDEVFQAVVRRVLWSALRRRPKVMPTYAEGAKLPIPTRMAALGAGAVARMEVALNKASDDAVRADLASLHGHLDRIDAWIADGVVGGESPNAADLQIASGLALLMTVGDVAPVVEAHPAGALARKWFPDYPGSTPAGVLPAEWLPAAERPSAAASASGAA